MNSNIYTPKDWTDYSLLDSGDNMRLEKYGAFTLATPDPRAIWHKTLKEEWNKADAIYSRSNSGGGSWKFNKSLPKEWTISWNNLKFKVHPTGFKHLGIFPEQANMWGWLIEKIQKRNKETNVLNLFAYTGGSTIACAYAGAKVTHLDSSKDTVAWAKENASVSFLSEKPIRWIIDDAIKFLKREINRGVKYDGIIMDPPKFGRGTKGEVWKIEEDIATLLNLCQQVLSEEPLFVVINAYTISFSALTLRNILSQTMTKFDGEIEFGELGIPQQSGGIILPTSIFSRWSSKS